MKNLDLLIPKKTAPSSWWTWATVTWNDPLRIRLDGETEPLDITPDNLAGKLQIGQRVWVQAQGRRMIVTGVSGGPSSTPTGVVEIFTGPVAPLGWLLCDGSPVSRIEFATLFDLIGTTFGSGDGSTTFNLPDLQGVFPIGAKTGLSLGAEGGSESKLIEISNLPPHDHSGTTGSDGNHDHQAGYSVGTGGNSYYAATGSAGGTYGINRALIRPDGAHTHPFTTDKTGGGQPLDIMPPFLAVNFIIKT